MKTRLLTFFLLGSIISFAQEKNQLKISIGSVIPLGNFQSTNLNSIESGYAKNGRNISVSYSRTLKKEYTLRLTLLALGNKMDNRPELNDFFRASPNSKYASIQGRAWDIRSVLLGASKRILLGESKFSIEPTVQVGLSNTQRPGLFISSALEDMTHPQSETFTEASSVSFQLGIDHNYSIKEAFDIFLSAHYFTTSPQFNFTRIEAYDKNTSPPTAQHQSYTQNIQVLMINLGVKHHF